MHPGAALARITMVSHGQPVVTWLFQDITLLGVFPTDKRVCIEKNNQTKNQVFFFTLYKTIAKIIFFFHILHYWQSVLQLSKTVSLTIGDINIL